MDTCAKADGRGAVTPVPGELVHHLLDAAAARTPDAPAVRDAAGTWTYAELAAASHAFRAWLVARGIGRGDRVVVQAPSTRELVATFYGTVRHGAVFVPLNPAMRTYHLASVVDNAEPALVIGAAAEAARMRGAVTTPVFDMADVWAQVAALRATGSVLEPDPGTATTDVAVLVYTSGSTAAPKAVICPHAQMTFATRSVVSVLGYRSDDVVFCRFPLSWDYGLYKVLMCTLAGAQIVLADDSSDLVLLARMRESGATIVPIVPSLATMIAALADRDPLPPPPVRMFSNTGAALPASTIAALRRLFPGVQVVRQFGQTECKRIAIMPPDEDEERPDSCGVAMPGTEVLILDADGLPVPPGEVGEIVVVGPHVMPGYWRNPELSETTFRTYEDGCRRLHTGDYGYLDQDGYLYFEGRRDDMFKRKGVRMSTVEIEAAAMDIEGVRAAAALPPTDDHDLVIFVEGELDPHMVLKELATRLEPQKVPARCRVLTEFPMTMHGKNARNALAEMLKETAR